MTDTPTSAPRVILVTGASAGIGEEVARTLRNAGHTVYAVARRVDRMAGLEAIGVHTHAADITVDADLVTLVDRIVAEQGRIDALVNNAGYGSYGALEDVDLDEARRQFEVNVFGLGRLTQLVIPHMRARGAGRIINISSMGGRFGEPLGSWYHATKYAVEGLSESIRPELAPFGIDVVVIRPGSIRTEWGAIAADHLRAASEGGPYAEQADLSGRVLSASSTPDSSASEPAVIAKAVAAAVSARRPRASYTVGAFAKPMLAARAILPARAFDRFLHTMVKANAK